MQPVLQIDGKRVYLPVAELVHNSGYASKS